MTLLRIIHLMTVVGLIAMMLSMGFRVTVQQVAASMRNRRQVAVGLAVNFAVIPATTIGLLYLFDAHPLVAAGFLILAVCPGAPVGPTLVSAAKGDVPCATGLMVLLAGLSAILSPILLGALLPRLVSATGGLQIDYFAVIRTLALSQMLPLAAGLAVHHWKPKLAGRIAKPIEMSANVSLLGVVALILVQQYESLAAIRLRGWCGMVLLLALSLAIGWFCGGPRRATRKALALTTAARNAAVALVIVSANFANTPAVTAVVAYSLFSIFAALGCAVLLAAMPENGTSSSRR